MAYDLFTSYSRRDNEQGRVTQLVERIKADFATFAKRELVVFFDEHDILGMDDWRQKILRGLRESRLLLVCLSPAYLQSGYCEWEFVEYLKYEIGHLHGFNGVAPIYFVEVPGWNDPGFEQQCAAWVTELRKRNHFDLRPWHDLGEAALRDTAVQDRMGQLNRRIAETILRGERAEQSLGNVDAHNPHFIGRSANLRMLRENFVTPGKLGVVTAVNGLGGLGKTAVAIEYAHAFADAYGGGRWQVRCAGKDDLRLALAELATPIGFEFTDEEKMNPDLQFERTRRELKRLAEAAPFVVPPLGGQAGASPNPQPGPPKGGTTNGRCLLLLDNVDRPGLLDPAQVARLNGGDWLHVLATTRLGENELHGAHRDRSFLAIDELPPDDALALLESYQPGRRFRSNAEREAAREIVRLLGCFTLAVESAAVYLGQYAHDVTCSAFLTRLKKEGLEGLDTAATQSSEGVLHGEKRFGATLQPTLERLGPAEELTLGFAALLPPDQVALPWLRALVAIAFPEMERDAEPGYPDPWKNVLRQLFSLRLIQSASVMDHDDQPLVGRVHRLVQQLVLDDCPADARAGLQQALDALVTERATTLRQTTRWENARWELEPLTALAGLWADTNHPDAAWLLNEAGLRWKNLAEWSQAEPLLRRALAIYETSSSPEPPDIACGLNNLAQLLLATNRLAEAEPLMRRALAIVEISCGPEHPNVATALNNLAGLLQDTNRLAEAEPMMRRVISIFETSFGPEHPNVPAALNNLAGLLQDTNRLAEAEPLLRRALATDETSFGPEHPNVAVDLNNLAHLLQATNRLAEAERLMRRALAIDESSFDPEHPIVALRLSNLAALLRDTNRLAEAEPLLRRALAIQESSFGSEHPDVATTLATLARLLQTTDRLAEAEPLLRQHLEIFLKFTRATGHRHPHLLAGLSNYASLLEAMGRSREKIRATLRELAPELILLPYGTGARAAWVWPGGL